MLLIRFLTGLRLNYHLNMLDELLEDGVNENTVLNILLVLPKLCRLQTFENYTAKYGKSKIITVTGINASATYTRLQGINAALTSFRFGGSMYVPKSNNHESMARTLHEYLITTDDFDVSPDDYFRTIGEILDEINLNLGAIKIELRTYYGRKLVAVVQDIIEVVKAL